MFLWVNLHSVERPHKPSVDVQEEEKKSFERTSQGQVDLGQQKEETYGQQSG